jgi:hypothetical protein
MAKRFCPTASSELANTSFKSDASVDFEVDPPTEGVKVGLDPDPAADWQAVARADRVTPPISLKQPRRVS